MNTSFNRAGEPIVRSPADAYRTFRAARLDLLVFVPLAEPDDISVPIEYPALRRKVDRRLKAILRDDDLGLFADGPRVLEISGTRDSRLQRLLKDI